MIDRLKCLVGLHDYEVHYRVYGDYVRCWRFCRHCDFYSTESSYVRELPAPTLPDPSEGLKTGKRPKRPRRPHG